MAKLPAKQVCFQSLTDDEQIFCCPGINREHIPPFWSKDIEQVCFCWGALGSNTNPGATAKLYFNPAILLTISSILNYPHCWLCVMVLGLSTPLSSSLFAFCVKLCCYFWTRPIFAKLSLNHVSQLSCVLVPLPPVLCSCASCAQPVF